MKKIVVSHFTRKPRGGFSFSIEGIFESVRQNLSGKIDASVKTCRCYNDGYFSKVVNIIEASFKQNKSVNHILGEVHFLDLLMRRRTVILTIHDCGMMLRKSGWSKRLVKWIYLIAPVRNAQIVTTVSKFTRDEIARYAQIDKDSIKVIPVPVSGIFTPCPKLFDSVKPNILQIGTAENKNLTRLLDAVSNIECKLTIIGSIPKVTIEQLHKKKIDYENYIGLSEFDLLQCYRRCDIVSFISTFEGFGMPIVEANAVGRVVITSNLCSMPEVAGNAAYIVNPFDTTEIKSGLLRLIQDNDLRQLLIGNGFKNKERFDAKKIAEEYYELYSAISED